MATNSENPGPMYDLNAFQRDVLYAISALDTPHGSEIIDFLEAKYEKVHNPRLYENLKQLVSKGLIERDYPEGSKRRKNNTITTRGRSLVRQDLVWREGCIGF